MGNMLQKKLFALEASFICNNIDSKGVYIVTIYYLLGNVTNESIDMTEVMT